MQISLLLTLAALGATAAAASSTPAQIAEQLPSCAQSCLTKAASKAGCSADDFTCLCAGVASLESAAGECFSDECDGSEVGRLNSRHRHRRLRMRSRPPRRRRHPHRPLQPAGATTTPPSGNDHHENTDSTTNNASAAENEDDGGEENGAVVMALPGGDWGVRAAAVMAVALLV
ncbi:unnamed protein product [Parascedosporium putredinis]|uniref:CFEM domain-containing protein n=1 Tax=Parascedosporium putredinis TaxID=1442378 RepID=A0A9P1HBU7_9PEZI|nr:unnamed protein product [Parascedosporium putredinis]CAI8004083.1 unnamed protein product [Parascedosporium putredinis]